MLFLKLWMMDRPRCHKVCHLCWDHVPSILSEFVKFLAAHAAFKEVQGLMKKLESFEKHVPEIWQGYQESFRLGEVKNVRSEEWHDVGKAIVVGTLTNTPDLKDNSTKAKKILPKAGPIYWSIETLSCPDPGCGTCQRLAFLVGSSTGSWLSEYLCMVPGPISVDLILHPTTWSSYTWYIGWIVTCFQILAADALCF
jgi:hypothetical protein